MRLLYFASVRQKVGRGEEEMSRPGDVSTIAELMTYLGARGGGYADAFAQPSRLRAARNQEHVSLDTRLSGDEEIAFFPPVTGG